MCYFGGINKKKNCGRSCWINKGEGRRERFLASFAPVPGIGGSKCSA